MLCGSDESFMLTFLNDDVFLLQPLPVQPQNGDRTLCFAPMLTTTML